MRVNFNDYFNKVSSPDGKAIIEFNYFADLIKHYTIFIRNLKAIELLEAILKIDPKKRPTSERILSHAYFRPFYQKDGGDAVGNVERFDSSFERVDLNVDEFNDKLRIF
jgi:serine/threonine protein kinase